MKITFIFLLLPLFLLAGCSSPKYTISPQNMEVVSAKYQLWSEEPTAGSEIPERGIDLWVVIKNWPEDYEPDYIIFNQRKSVSGEISEQSGDTTVIKARIIQASSVLVETSETVDVSDRLVFTSAEGHKGYLPIEHWERQDKQVD